MVNKLKNEVIIQFSGGIDSLYVAYLLGKKYDKVHLLTFYKGYLHFGMNFSKVNIDNLKKILGDDKIVFKLIDIKKLFKRMAVNGFLGNSKEYGKEIAWCIPCRASMAISSIIYAIENNIPDYTDGANWEQAPDGKKIIVTADNYPGFLALINKFSENYKVNYFSPVYELTTREKRRKLLLKLGFKIDWNSLDVESPKALSNLLKKDFYKRYQPLCLSGWLVHWKRNLFKKKENLSEEKVLDFIEPKLASIGKEYITDYFKNKNNDLTKILSFR